VLQPEPEHGKTILAVTHDPARPRKADSYLDKGQLSTEKPE
jgi:ABC-type siderophore export system fused ATPase/permease subunit